MSNAWTAIIAVGGFAVVLFVLWQAIRVRSKIPPSPKLTEEERERIRREIKLDSDNALAKRMLRLLQLDKKRRGKTG
jgi:hypothetical protein